MGAPDGDLVARVDRALADWRQGDCVVGDHWFAFRVATDGPLTDSAAAAAVEEADVAEALVRGLMVATQTCDIVRTCAERPFAEVCPLVEVSEERFPDVLGRRTPRYAYVSGVADLRLVADLDRVMTVEKPVLVGWERTGGCADDHERRDLAEALARKRVRVAFPDDFVALVSKLQKRITSKHSKGSPEGDALRALREIRVTAAPSWDAEQASITFWFIRDDEPDEMIDWSAQLDGWLSKIPAGGRFTTVDGVVLHLADMTAQDYVDSDRLDLDHLSQLA